MELPSGASWRHEGAREGFEVVFFRTEPSGCRLQGTTAAVESGAAWVVGYDITVDEHWLTRSAHVWASWNTGNGEVRLHSDGEGHWEVNGSAAHHLDGCLDVDLESSACTNTLPVHRLGLGVGGQSEAPAAHVRALDLAVERLEQQYARLSDAGAQWRFRYAAPSFDFECVLVYDHAGLVIDYPGIAHRIHSGDESSAPD